MFFQVLGHFMLDRRLQQLPGSFREQLFQVALGFIFGSLFERNHFSFHFRCILSFGASSESAVFFLVTERMRLSLSCHPQLSVIAQENAMNAPSEDRKPVYDRALLLHGPKRDDILTLEAVRQYGIDSSCGPAYVRVYGMAPTARYGQGIRVPARPARESTRD